MSFYNLQPINQNTAYAKKYSPKYYLYSNYNTHIILEEQNDYNRSLKVKEIIKGSHYGNIYEKTKYIKYDNNKNNTYVNPVPISPLVEYFDIGETIHITMINDGLIFTDINDAANYSMQKHEAKLKKDLEKKEMKRQKKMAEDINNKEATHKFKKLMFGYVTMILLFASFLIYFVLICIPWMTICIIVNTFNYGYLYAYRSFLCDTKDLVKYIKLFCCIE